MPKKTIKSPILFRTLEFRQDDIDVEHRSVALSFSSELPVERWFGVEILDHSAGSMRTDRAAKGLPLLVNHSRNDQIGRCNDVDIGKDKRGHAVAIFGKSSRASEIFQDVQDGIRQEVSFGYRVHAMVLEKQEKDKPDVYRVSDWEPYEISLETIPADYTVGVGRTSGDREYDVTVYETPTPTTKEVRTMNYCPFCGKELVEGLCPDGCKAPQAPNATRAVTVTSPVMPDTTKIEGEIQRRIAEILAIGEQHKCTELAHEAVRKGASVEDFRKLVLEQIYSLKLKPVQTMDPSIGMSRKDLKQWSIVRGINASITGDWSDAGLEREASEAVAKVMKKTAQGFFVPSDVMGISLGEARGIGQQQSQNVIERFINMLMHRDLQKVNWAAGGALVATELLASSFIEMLRAKTRVKQLGATVMSGLVGDCAIPKQTGTATGYWIAEGAAPTESQQTVGQVGLTPKTCGAFTDYSRKLMNQASIDIEAFVRNDLASIIAIQQDLAAIKGTGINGEPLGILNWPSVNVTALGVNGAAITHAGVVGLETQVMTANADIGAMAYLTGPALYGALKTTPKTGAILEPIWSDRTPDRPLNGYPCAISTQVPANLSKGTGVNLKALIFGVWSTLIIAEWGTVDIIVNPYVSSQTGNVRVSALMDTDINTRHQQAFSVIKDAT